MCKKESRCQDSMKGQGWQAGPRTQCYWEVTLYQVRAVLCHLSVSPASPPSCQAALSLPQRHLCFFPVGMLRK